jgi:phosphoribosylanthranilate isomerase
VTFIKLCGMTRAEDVALAAEIGADAVGFVLWPDSPRAVTPARLAALVRAVPPTTTPVGVFVTPSADDISRAIAAGIRVVQVHGAVDPHLASPVAMWFARSLETGVRDVPPTTTVVLDAHDAERHGGTGRTIDWARAAAIAACRRVLLAGGLTPANVTDAIRQVRPFGVDVASGVEDRPGIKNAQAMKAFVAAVREADQ